MDAVGGDEPCLLVKSTITAYELKADVGFENRVEAMKFGIEFVIRAAVVAEQDVDQVVFSAIYEQGFLTGNGFMDYAVVVIDDGVGPGVAYLVGTEEEVGGAGFEPGLGVASFVQVGFDGDDGSVVFAKNFYKG